MKYVDLGGVVPQKKLNTRNYIGVASSGSGSKQNKKGFTKVIVILLVLIGLVASVTLFGDNAVALFDPVSIVSDVATANLNETDGRTNVLLLGSDQRALASSEAGVLTDTLLVASIGRVEGDVVLLSLPRDLWVTTPGGYRTKINAVYEYGGGKDTMQVVEEVLGIPMHYYTVIDFELFKESIDILGGIDVYVDKTFDDFYYPVEGKENAPLAERYETVHFDEGLQTMDGETALKYVRSRKGNNGEGTDFARSKRQQKVIMAIRDKALSLETILDVGRVKELYDAYSSNVDTNIGFREVQGFYLLSQQIQFDSVKSYVLDDRSAADEGGLLYAPEDKSLYGGAYVLIPREGDYGQIHAYVQRYFFGE